jgi:integrase
MKYCIQPLPNKKELHYKYDNIFCKDDTYTKFTGNGSHLPFKLFRTKQEVTELLNKFRETSFEDYIFFCILAFTGMRIGGACNIKIRNIDLKERRIVTDEKITEFNGKDNKYVIPIPFVPQLEAYMLQIKDRKKKPEFLFGQSQHTYFSRFKDQDSERHPHQFRDTINTFRMKKGVNDSVLAIFLSQKPKGVNAQKYMKIFNDFSVRRDYYDYYFPYYDYFHYYFKPNEWNELEKRVKDLD